MERLKRIAEKKSNQNIHVLLKCIHDIDQISYRMLIYRNWYTN